MNRTAPEHRHIADRRIHRNTIRVIRFLQRLRQGTIVACDAYDEEEPLVRTGPGGDFTRDIQRGDL